MTLRFPAKSNHETAINGKTLTATVSENAFNVYRPAFYRPVQDDYRKGGSATKKTDGRGWVWATAIAKFNATAAANTASLYSHLL